MSGLAGISIGAKLLGARKALARVPWWAWLALAAVALLGWRELIYWPGKIRAADRTGFSRGVDVTKAAYKKALADARAVALKRRAAQEAAAAAITRSLNDETARLRARIAADARALQLQGPGKARLGARCVDRPGVPATPGTATASSKSAALAALPPAEGERFAVVPWAGAVALAANHDAMILRLRQWEEWHRRQEELWQTYRERGKK